MTRNVVQGAQQVSHSYHGRFVLALALRCVAAAGLLADAWIHADLASNYDVVQGSIGEGTLFRLEAAAAAVAAFLILGWWRWFTGVFAFVIAVSAIGALLLSTYTNPGEIGPLPNMYEPTWFTEKSLALVAEAAAAVASLGVIVLAFVRPRGLRY